MTKRAGVKPTASQMRNKMIKKLKGKTDKISKAKLKQLRGK